MSQIVEYSITDAAIAEMKSMYMGLKVLNLDDKEGFKAVHSARMIVKGKRCEVEKRRKELKADALEYGKKVDSEAKRILGLLEPIETHLTNEEEKITKEKERLRAEQEAEEKAKIERRVNALFQYGVMLPFADVAAMSEKEFEQKLTLAISVYETEQARIIEEKRRLEEIYRALQKAQEEERARLEIIRKKQEMDWLRLDAIQKEQAETNRKIEEEREALEDAKWAEKERLERKDFEKQAAENARIQAEKEAQEKIEREALEKKEKEAREEAEEAARKLEKIRVESLRPDKEKLVVWAQQISAQTLPQVSDTKAKEIVVNANGALQRIVKQIIKQANEL